MRRGVLRSVIHALSLPSSVTTVGVGALVLLAQVSSGCLSNEYRIPKDELWRLTQLPPEHRGQRVRVVQELGDRRDEAVNPDDGMPPASPPGEEDGDAAVDWGGHLVLQGNWGPPVVRTGPRGVARPAPVVRGTSAPRPGPGGGAGHGLRLAGCCAGGSGEDALVLAAVVLASAAFVATIGLAASEGARFDGHAAVAPDQFVYLKDSAGRVTESSIAALSPVQVASASEATIMDDEGAGLRRLGRVPLNRRGGAFRLDVGTSSFNYGTTQLMGPAAHIQAGVFLTQQIGLLADLALSGASDCCVGTIVRHSLALELDALPLKVGPVHAGVFAKGGMALMGAASNRQSGPLVGGGALLEIELTSRLALTFRAGADSVQLDDGWSSAGTLTGGLTIY